MESGTLLHIALLRKTSKANKRPKLACPQPKKTLAFPPTSSLESNYILSGWSTEETELSIPINLLKANNSRKLRQSLEQKQKNYVLSERTNAKTSDCTHRPRLRSHSFRKYVEYKSASQIPAGDTGCQRPKQNRNQHCLDQIKLGKSAAHTKNEQENREQKQNTSSPQLGTSTLKFNQIWRWQNGMGNPRSFANFLNFNALRERKFFKL